MGFLGLFKKQPPDLRTLGKWLWNNDVALLNRQLQGAELALFKELVESGVIPAVNDPSRIGERAGDMIAGHLTNLLDGGYLVQGYAPKASDRAIIAAAEATHDLILRGNYPSLRALSVVTGSLLAIRTWYSMEFTESIAIATHVISIATEKGGAEAHRVRGFGHFALGDHTAALADILEAKRREPGLVGINEPLKALRRLTNTSARGDKAREPAGLAMYRDALGTFSSILHVSAAAAGNATAPNEALDFAAMARLADRLLKSKALERPRATMGDIIDFAKCALSSKVALTMWLQAKGRPGRASLPTEQKIREALGTCMFFLQGTDSINSGLDPNFNGAVQELQREVDSLFADLDSIEPYES